MPMASKVDIVNLALALIGGKPILSFDDLNSKEATLARSTYDALRDDCLEAHPWRFATKRADLVKSATVPDFGYSSAWDVPNDCLRVLSIEGTGPGGLSWVREGDLVLCDIDAPCEARYIWRNEDVITYSPSFIKTFSQRLQAEWAEAITRNSTVQKTQFELADKARLTAGANSGQEGTPPVLGADHWIDRR